VGDRFMDHCPHAAAPRLRRTVRRRGQRAAAQTPVKNRGVQRDRRRNCRYFPGAAIPDDVPGIDPSAQTHAVFAREFELAFNASTDPIERSRRAIVRCYMAFHHSALFNPKKMSFADARHNKGGSSKMSEWASYPRALASICRRLCGVLIEHSDALRVIRVQDSPDTLFFVDPPYVAGARNMSVFYRHEMDDGAHRELLTQLRGIKGRAMVCGYPSRLYDEMLAGWRRVERRHYAGGSGALSRTEVLWISPPPAQHSATP
jgi:DNA adenine methylase